MTGFGHSGAWGFALMGKDGLRVFGSGLRV